MFEPRRGQPAKSTPRPCPVSNLLKFVISFQVLRQGFGFGPARLSNHGETFAGKSVAVVQNRPHLTIPDILSHKMRVWIRRIVICIWEDMRSCDDDKVLLQNYSINRSTWHFLFILVFLRHTHSITTSCRGLYLVLFVLGVCWPLTLSNHVCIPLLFFLDVVPRTAGRMGARWHGGCTSETSWSRDLSSLIFKRVTDELRDLFWNFRKFSIQIPKLVRFTRRQDVFHHKIVQITYFHVVTSQIAWLMRSPKSNSAYVFVCSL